VPRRSRHLGVEPICGCDGSPHPPPDSEAATAPSSPPPGGAGDPHRPGLRRQPQCPQGPRGVAAPQPNRSCPAGAVARAAEWLGIDRDRACIWWRRHRVEGLAGLEDRSGGPHRCPARTKLTGRRIVPLAAHNASDRPRTPGDPQCPEPDRDAGTRAAPIAGVRIVTLETLWS